MTRLMRADIHFEGFCYSTAVGEKRYQGADNSQQGLLIALVVVENHPMGKMMRNLAVSHEYLMTGM